LKQEICNYILGASFKDVDKAMRSIIADRNPPDDLDDMETIEYKPLTKDDIGVSDLPVAKTSRYKTLSLEETMILINKGNAPVVEPPHKVSRYYETYSQEQVQKWVTEHLADREKIDGLQRGRPHTLKKPHN
jgi:hypothetical protein